MDLKMVDWLPYQTAMFDPITIHHQFWGGVNKCSDKTDMDPNFSDRGAGHIHYGQVDHSTA